MMNTWTTDDGLTPAQRITHDVLVNEQQLRALAEKHSRELRQLLRDLVARFNAQALDDRLRADPRAVEKFTLADWRAFFADLSPVMDVGWGQTITLTEYTAVQTQLQAAHRENAQLQAALTQALATKTAPGEAAERADATPQASATSAVAGKPPTWTWPLIPDHWPSGWQTPMRMSDTARPAALWQLWLIATQGWPLFMEGRHWLTQAHRVGQNQAHDAAETLIRDGLIEPVLYAQVLPRDGAETTSVRAGKLTRLGQQLCQAFGWRVGASELDRLRQTTRPEREIAGGLFFAAQARMRGHTVQVQADGLVQVDDHLVVLALGDEPPSDLTAWQRLVEQQGTLALCTVSPQRRARHSAAAQAQGWAGQATDLQTLNTHKEAPLWAEKWALEPVAQGRALGVDDTGV